MIDLRLPTAVSPSPTSAAPISWDALADRVLSGHVLTSDEALAILRSDDDELLECAGRGLPRSPPAFRQTGAASIF